MGVNVQSLADLAAWTRATEYKKGGYVSLTEPLPDYPLFNMLLQRETIKSTPRINFQLLVDPPNSFQVVQVADPVSVSIPNHAKTAQLNWCKMRTAWAYYTDEEAFNGAGDDEIIDVVTARKVEHDAEFRRNLELKLAGEASETVKNDIIGLKDWLPVGSTNETDDLTLNGGGDVAYGLSGITVSDVPRWAHATAGFTKLSDDDLFDKLSRFMHNSKYYVPDGARSIESGEASRCILANTNIFTQWERLQTVSNDNLGSDVGKWRGTINFRSVPVKKNYAQSVAGNGVTPDDHALLYMLDLNTWKFFVHSDFNFVLDDPVISQDVPGEVKQWRQLYAQLACVNREKNLVCYTEQADFLA